MAHLKFRQSQKENWKSNFDVKFHFDYDINLEKKVRSVTFFNHDLQKKLTIPWTIFLYYSERKPSHAFLDSNSGLKLWFKGKNLVISDSRFFNLLIHEDQLEAILLGAIRYEKDFSSTVESVLKEFISRENKAIPSPS